MVGEGGQAGRGSMGERGRGGFGVHQMDASLACKALNCTRKTWNKGDLEASNWSAETDVHDTSSRCSIAFPK